MAEDDPAYQPPPAFAPPGWRIAALNEADVLGTTSYPQSPYPQASYPQPSYPQAPFHRPSSVGQRRRLGRRGLIAAGAVVAALVAVVVALTVTSTGSGTSEQAHRLALPDTVGNYRLENQLTGAELSTLGGAGVLGTSVPDADLSAALAGHYRSVQTAAPNVLFVGFNADDSPGIGADLHRLGPDQTTLDLLTDVGLPAGQQSFAPGPLGGSLRGAIIVAGNEEVAVGVWADHDTLGIVLAINGIYATAPPRVEDAVQLARDMRAAAEH